MYSDATKQPELSWSSMVESLVERYGIEKPIIISCVSQNDSQGKLLESVSSFLKMMQEKEAVSQVLCKVGCRKLDICLYDSSLEKKAKLRLVGR
jgi:hypothetical protein